MPDLATRGGPAGALPGPLIRFLIGAMAGGSLSTFVVLIGADGMTAILATAFPFGAALAWLGHTRSALPITWAASVFFLMPGFYYLAIWTGMLMSEGIGPGNLFATGLFGGMTGAFLIWFWTGIFDNRRFHWTGFARTLGLGALTGAVVLSGVERMNDWGLVVLHVLWQGAMLAVLPTLPRGVDNDIQGREI